MRPPPEASRRRSGLTPAGFNRLLARLHHEPDRAAEEYRRIHTTLVRFFDWRGIPRPEDCADTTLDRLAHRLEEDIDVRDVRQYTLGIARLVLLEARRVPSPVPLDEAHHLALTPAAAGDEDRDRGFDRCLEELPSESRAVLLRYYDGASGPRKFIRRQLAQTLGISESALRNRVQRLKDRLAQCMAAPSVRAEEGDT